jgi:hypothetical protein
MKGTHEDREGSSKFLYIVYYRGSIVRLGADWGVVTHVKGNKFHQVPIVIWWRNGEWVDFGACRDRHISAPYAHAYEHIPDEVRAKATEIILLS